MATRPEKPKRTGAGARSGCPDIETLRQAAERGELTTVRRILRDPEVRARVDQTARPARRTGPKAVRLRHWRVTSYDDVDTRM